MPIPEPPPLDAPPVSNIDSDPLEQLDHDFGELIEITDGTEFVGYKKEDDDFSQEDLFSEDNDKEEFLEDGELGNDTDN